MSVPSPLFDSLGYGETETNAFARAVAHGARATNLGEAFFEGYQSALAHLVDPDVSSKRASFCVTERGGGHPKAIECTVRTEGDTVVLDGEKTFVTAADRAALLFVVARSGTHADGRPELRLVRVPIGTEGATLTALPKTPFAQSVDHAKLTLRGVRLPAAAMLPGDAYLRYVKPFRTVEDVHVVGAVAAFIVSFALELPEGRDLVERFLGVVVALEGIARRAPDSPGTHLALAGIFTILREQLPALTTAIETHPEEARRAELRRDLALLSIAETVRRARRESAWQAFAGVEPL